MTNETELVIEVGDQDFEQAVLERSKQVPVVVDLWAPWCAPCRALGPLLERLAGEHAGQFVLAKVNVDNNPAVAQALGASSIPLVLGFRDGKAVAEFVGALPEPAVREFLVQLLPSAAENLASEAERLTASGAEALYRRALDLDGRCARALLGLAKILSERGEHTAALTLLDRIAPGPLRQDADRLSASIRVRLGGSGDEDALQAKVASNPADLDSRLQLAQVLASASKPAAALAQYLEIVRRDRRFHDEAARKAMLDLFALLGPEHELTLHYRSELAKVLFS